MMKVKIRKRRRKRKRKMRRKKMKEKKKRLARKNPMEQVLKRMWESRVLIYQEVRSKE